MLARFVVLAVVAVGAVGAVACGPAEDSAKKPLPVCDAKDPECPGVQSSAPKTPKTEIPTDPVPGPATTTEPTTQPAPPADAGASVDAAPVVGMLCQKLAACCKQLADAGYDPKTCNSVLSTNNEDACYTQHASYKSFGDCT